MTRICHNDRIIEDNTKQKKPKKKQTNKENKQKQQKQQITSNK